MRAVTYNGMTDRVRADADARCPPDFVQAIEPRRFTGEESVRIAGLCRADVNEFIDVIITPGQTKDRSGNHGAGRADLQSVRLGSVNIIGALASGRAVHKLHHNRRIAGNIFFQIRNQRARLKLARAAGTAAAHDE